MRSWLGLALILASFPAIAAPPPGVDPNSPLGRYYQSLYSPRGNQCCGEGDCGRPLKDVYYNGSNWVVVTANGYVVNIPSEIITGPPHPSGQAVFCYADSGSPVYPVNPICFVPPLPQG